MSTNAPAKTAYRVLKFPEPASKITTSGTAGTLATSGVPAQLGLKDVGIYEAASSSKAIRLAVEKNAGKYVAWNPVSVTVESVTVIKLDSGKAA